MSFFVNFVKKTISNYTILFGGLMNLEEDIIVLLDKYSDYFDKLFDGVDSKIKLDEEQQKCILIDAKAQMIIAGAGSGKTTTVSAKVKYLTEILNVKDEEILIISYTNKAVDELKDRINRDFGINCMISTFHKFAYSLLKENNYKLISDADKYSIIKSIIIKNSNNLTNNYVLSKLNNQNFFVFVLNKIFNKEINLNNSVILLSNIINLIKMSKYNYTNILDVIVKDKLSSDDKRIIKYIDRLYRDFVNQTINKKIIDFEDMVNLSLKKIDRLDNFKYKYIIVDEYQDISLNRYNLLKKLVDKFGVKLIVVGDDWQSIFKFSGSKIDLFTNFDSLFDGSNISYISNTYRNSQELIDIAGKFVMKNKNQKIKHLISIKHIDNPVEIIFYSAKEYINKLINILNEININERVLLLGRYSFDITKIKQSNKFICNHNKIIYRKRPDMDITFLTIHSAKGLGFDQVIIINNNSGIYGFPTNKKNHKVLDLFIDGDNLNEERRLFYVALTRTKNKVYLLAPKYNYSIFIKEIVDYNKVLIRK